MSEQEQYIKELEQTNRILAQLQINASDRLQEQVAGIRREAKADALEEFAAYLDQLEDERGTRQFTSSLGVRIRANNIRKGIV